MADARNTITSEPDRFGRAVLAAAVLEIFAVAGLFLLPKPAPVVPPSVVQLQVLAPAPVPVAKPPPPKPPPPLPKPAPAPPLPVAPPLPPPPPVAHRTVARRIIHHIVHTPPPPQAPPPVPEPPAPVTAAPPVSPLAEQSAMSRYISEVRAIVQGNLEVPQQLIDEDLSSTCVLEFTVGPDGTLLSVSVVSPSGIAAVNQAALDALRGSRLPAFLAGMPAGPHSFTLPVHESGDEN